MSFIDHETLLARAATGEGRLTTDPAQATRQAIREALLARPLASDRGVAAAHNVGADLVAEVRAELEAAGYVPVRPRPAPRTPIAPRPRRPPVRSLDPDETPIPCRWCDEVRPKRSLVHHERQCRRNPAFVPPRPRPKPASTLALRPTAESWLASLEAEIAALAAELQADCGPEALKAGRRIHLLRLMHWRHLAREGQ